MGLRQLRHRRSQLGHVRPDLFRRPGVRIHWEHPFDWIFYKTAYEGLAKGGNCFGMSIESAYAQVGRSLFGEPIVTYPPNATDLQEINIKMGYELGGDFIDWFLGQWISDSGPRPDQYVQRQPRPVQSRRSPGDLDRDQRVGRATGHCVRPYRWFDGDYAWQARQAGDCGRQSRTRRGCPIPTRGRPEAAVPDNDPSCLIVIDKASNTFVLSAAHGSADDLLGRQGQWRTSGFSISVPASSRRSRARPFWEALALLVAGTLIIFGGDAKTQQITDGSGRTFYEPGLVGAARDARRRPQGARGKRIPNMARVPSRGAGTAPLVKGRGRRAAQVEAAADRRSGT